MLSFSQRKGLVQVSEVIQVDSMNDVLRNSIWNALTLKVWRVPGFMYDSRGDSSRRINQFVMELWGEYLKLPVDSRPLQPAKALDAIRQTFYQFEWNEVYDFLEFMVTAETGLSSDLTSELNRVLERENSAYRIVANTVTDITAQEEMQMLDEAIRDTKFAPVSSHLQRALVLLADRETPDYRNSIKESISAVESMAKIVANDPKATLAQALKALEKNEQMHTALKDGFLKLYGYTNDADGIRHAMLEEPNLKAADAKYFLMSCTSFANYLKAQMPT
jgi:hypothetical protein